MKYFIFFTLLVSSNVFAIDFYKVTGSFELNETERSTDEKSNVLAYGSFETTEDVPRIPASNDEESRKKVISVTEMSGTFE